MMTPFATITSTNHGLQAGDRITFTQPETRWLVRLWKFMTYQDYNIRLIPANVVQVNDTYFTF